MAEVCHHCGSRVLCVSHGDDSQEIVHDPGCPTQTDVWRNLNDDKRCTRCHEGVGEHYTHVHYSGESFVSCLGCAALDMVAGMTS